MKNKIVNTSNWLRCKKSSWFFIAVSFYSMNIALADNNGFVANARLPTNAQKTCTTDIDSWFFSGAASKDGWVKPANSLNPIFADSKNNTRCDFYKWGSQMFLWLTSQGADQHVFTSSPAFYNVSVTSDGQRAFESSNGVMNMTVRKGKTDEEIEVGQAGNSDALLSQKDSLVYYSVHANDVYALFTTQQKNKIIPACVKEYQQCASEIVGECKKEYVACITAPINNVEFPNTQKQLNAVSSFAAKYGYPLGWDKMALAMELKTSWVDASTVDQSQYVLGQAIVPVFDRSQKAGPWPVSKNEQKTLALVGMHVVGTVNGHPEMVWSTFEHVDNVPDNAYVYNISNKSSATRPYNSEGKQWNFIKESSAKPSVITANANVSTGQNSSAPVQITCVKDPQNASKCQDPNAIGPTDVIRVDPWGNLHGSTNKTSKGQTAVANNTDLVSINVSVLSQLSDGDVRGNYIQTGGIWTVKGQIPPDGSDSDLRGSLNLANTTMETFYQYHTDGFNPINCFGCHGSSTDNATGISHVFDELQPLPPKLPLSK